MDEFRYIFAISFPFEVITRLSSFLLSFWVITFLTFEKQNNLVAEGRQVHHQIPEETRHHRRGPAHGNLAPAFGSQQVLDRFRVLVLFLVTS